MVSFYMFQKVILYYYSIQIPDTIEDFEIELKYCGCKRRIKKLPAHQNSAHNVLFNHTTCSLDAYNRGIGQKIVAYSLFGDYTSDRL